MAPAVLAAAALCLSPFALQDNPVVVPPERMPLGLPKPVKQTASAGGGLYVEFETEYRWFHYAPITMGRLECVNSCRGRRHQDHVQCDVECDTSCATKHNKEIAPIVTFGIFHDWLFRRFRQLEGTKKFGLYPRRGRGSASTVVQRIEWATTDHLTKPHLRGKASVVPSAAHWNDMPCSTMTKEVRYQVYYLIVKYEVRDSHETIDRGETLFATSLLPQSEMPVDLAGTNCRCSGLSTHSIQKLGDILMPSPSGDEKKERTPRPTSTLPPKPPTEQKPPARVSGLVIERDGKAQVATATDVEGMGLSVSAASMNSVSLAVTNTWTTGVSFAMPPGTLLVPEDASFQTIILGSPLSLKVASLGEVCGSVLQSSAAAFSLCAQMDRRAPDGRVKYDFQAATDSALTSIGALVARSSFRGPWHQAMIWIYTDAATLSQINERLIPGVVEWQYLDALHDLHDRCEIDLTDRRYAACLDPSLLDSPGARRDSVAWFVSALDRAALHRWTQSARQRFQAWLSGDEKSVRHAGWIASALAERPEAELQLASVGLLAGCPVPVLDRMADEGSLAAVAALVSSDDAQVCDAAVRLFEGSPTQFAWAFLQVLPPTAAAALRARADAVVRLLDAEALGPKGIYLQDYGNVIKFRRTWIVPR